VETACKVPESCFQGYEYLSSEDRDPYLVFGKPPLRRESKRAANKWPDARSCLIRSERLKERPDLGQIDWRRMLSKSDAEVCIFRIFSSLGKADVSSKWLDYQGFQSVGHRSISVAGKKFIQVQGYNFPEKSGKVFVSSWSGENLFKRIFVHNERIVTEWDLKGVLQSVSYEITIE